jgi:hypothetical protein
VVARRVELSLRYSPVTLAAGALIAAHTVVLLAVVPRSYFWEDDYLHLLQARTEGLHVGLLVQDYNDHLEVLPNLVYWALGRLAGASFLLPALLLIGLALWSSILMWLVLRELFGPRPRLLVPLALFLFSPLCLVPDTWLASGIELLPLLVSMLATCLCMLRYQHRGRYGWLVGSWAANAAGLLCWEKAVLILPFTLGVVILIAWAGLPWRDRWRKLAGAWLGWLGHVVLVLGFVALYLSVVDGSERVSAHAAPYLRSAVSMVAEVFLPGLFGGPWWVRDAAHTLYPTPGVGLVVFFLALAAVVVYASIRISGRRALAAWALLAGHLAVAVTLVLWGRGAYLQLVAHDPRYLVDVLPTAVIALAASFTPRRGLRPTPRQRQLSHWFTVSIGGSVAVVVAASGLLTTFQLVPVVSHGNARNYVEALRQQIAANPGRAIADGPVPPEIVPLAQSQMLAALGIENSFGQPGTRMHVFDGLGRLVPAEIPHPALYRRGPAPGCGWKVHTRPVRLPDLPAGTSRDAVVRLGYLAGQPGLLHLAVGRDVQTLAVPGGLGEAWFQPVTTGPMRVWLTRNSTGTCLADLSVGTAWPVS